MAGVESAVHVLCIDDDEDLLSVLTQMLETVDPELTAHSLNDPTEAPERLASNPDIECVVSDYDMPELNGLDVLETIRADHPELPFILYTGKGSEEIASEAISAGVTDYLQKGSGMEHYELLVNRINEYVDRYRAAKEYELSEQRYRRLVEQSVVGIGLSQDGVFRYVNPKFASMFGYSPEELVGMETTAVIAEGDTDRVREAIQRREAGEVDSVHYVVTAVDKEGNEFDIEVNGSRVSYEGEPAVLGVVQPLNTRRKALAEADAEAVPELQIRLERALGHLETADGGQGTQAARDAVASTLESLTSEPSAAVDGVGTVDIETCCRATLSEADVDASVTVESTRTIVAGRTALAELFEALWDAWQEAVGEFSVVLDAVEGAFEVTVEPATDDRGERPADPPALSRTVELLEWDAYVTDTESGGRRYSFREVDEV